jgi:hypothetical protein
MGSSVELKYAAGLGLIGLLVPLIALYLLKTRRAERVVSSTWLWAAAARDLLAHSPFRRLVAQVSLICEALALVALGIAWARPASRVSGVSGDHVAVIVDTSASMGAMSADGVTRFELARREADRLFAALPPGADAMLIEAAAEAVVVAPLDRDRRRLRAALARLRVRDVEGHLGRAIALGNDRLRSLSGSRRIAVITDGGDAEARMRADVPLSVLPVGAAVDNTALVRMDVRRGTDPVTRRDQVQVFGLVAHYGREPRDLYVTLRQKNVDQPIDSRRLRVTPGARVPVVLTFEPTPADLGTGLLLEMSPPDRLPVDDRAYGRVPPGRRLTVVVAPKNASAWVERALLADPEVELLGTSLRDLATADVPDDALVVVDGACPDRLPGGDLLLLNPPVGSCRTAKVGAPADALRVTSWAESDPRLTFVNLDGVEVRRARSLEPEGPRESLVRAGETTLVADASSPDRSATLLGFDVSESNWPLKASFVVFVRNVVERSRERRARGITGPARTGEPLRLKVPVDVDHVAVEAPDGESSQATAHEGLVVLPALGRAGFYHASWQGKRPGSVLVAANLVSSLESDAGSHPAPPEPPRASAARGTDQTAHREWGWVLGALGLLCLLVDAWWLTRRARLVPLGAIVGPRAPGRQAP